MTNELKYEIQTNITLNGDIQLTELTSFGDESLKEFQAGVFKTKDKAIIAALKSLGWAAPEERAELRERVEHYEAVLRDISKTTVRGAVQLGTYEHKHRELVNKAKQALQKEEVE